MALVRDDDVIRLEIPHEPGDWIEVKRLLTGSDRDACLEASVQAAGSGLSSNGAGPELQLTVRLTAYNRTLLERVVKLWSYAEPVSPENLASLDEGTHDWLLGELGRLYPVRTAAEKKGSTKSSSPASAGMAAGRRN